MMYLACIYEMLVAFGHSPAKAAEICYDAQRHDEHARYWIWTLFKRRHNA